jgi:hypothetical protein
MKTKKCTVCKEEKKICEFNKNKTKKDGLNNVCSECSQIKSKQYYLKNKEKHKKTVLNYTRETIKQNRKKYFELLKNSCCVDCGNNNPLVLEHDHKDGVDKVKGVGELVKNGTSWKMILEEINKCEIRCANCHRIRTAKQFNWYKDLI